MVPIIPSASADDTTRSFRDELVEIVTRDPISAGGDQTWANDLVDAFRAEVEREVRAAVAADFDRRAKRTTDFLSPGQAREIALHGLCACSGGTKPCDMGGAS
ncbi:hypothetical protein [Streptomyces sp. NPDC087525]|uniref:hypothetical protein n=1 Tax=Streptomyces sp. NPDC087525 TaxID=3365793 RepID=UPI00381696FF